MAADPLVRPPGADPEQSEEDGERNGASKIQIIPVHVPRASRHGRMRPGPHKHTHSYRSASAGRILEADHDGYSVATNETSKANPATQSPSISRDAKGT